MCGWLNKSSVKMPSSGNGEGGDIFGMVVNGIGSGLKFGLKTFTETIQIKQTKEYFALKNGVLYWYAHERAREAIKSIDLKEAKAVDLSNENPKEFYIIHQRKCYRLLCEHEMEAQKWVNSLKAVRDGGGRNEEHLDENRYEKLKVYSRITGKSMYKEYELLLELYEEKLHDMIEVKLLDYLNKKKRLKSIEQNLLKASSKSKKPSLTASKVVGRGSDAF